MHEDYLEQDRRARRRQAKELGDQFVESLGRDAARAGGVFNELLPELLLGTRGAAIFGRGYATEIASPRESWRRMLEVLEETPNAHAGLMLGFLEGVLARDRELAEDLLGDLLIDPALTKWYPILQSALPLDQRALERLHIALTIGVTGQSFHYLANGALDTVPSDEFRRLVLAIADAPDGYSVRYPIAAATVIIYTKAGEPSRYEWTELAYALLSRAPDPAAALVAIVRRLVYPSGWSGSLATKLESRLQLLERLDLTRIPRVEPALAQAKAALRSRIASERERA